MSECETDVNGGENRSEERTFHDESDDQTKFSSENPGSGDETTDDFNARQNLAQPYENGASGRRGENGAVLPQDNASYIMLDYGQQISIKDNVIEIHAVGNGEAGEGNNQQYAGEHSLKSEYGMSTDGSIQAQPCDSYATEAARKLHYPEDQDDGERMSNDEDSKVSDESLPHIMSFTASQHDGNADMEHSVQYGGSSGTPSSSTPSPSYAESSCPTSGIGQNFDCNFRRPPAPMSTPAEGQYALDSHRMLRPPSYPRMPHVRTPHPMHMMYMPAGTRNMIPPPTSYYPSPGQISHFPSAPQGYHSQGMAIMGDGLNSSGEDHHSSPEYPTVPNNTPSSMIDGTPHRPMMGPLDNKAPLFVPQLHSICTSVAAARQHHNAKERMRRARVKDACQLLRELVPGMTDKTDKATVFEFGTQYILFLKERIGKKYDREFLQKYSPY